MVKNYEIKINDKFCASRGGVENFSPGGGKWSMGGGDFLGGVGPP